MPYKLFYNLFCLETSKNGHSRVMYSPKIPSYSLICLFIYHYFPDVPFCFLKLVFCFPEVPFCFLDVPFPFSEIHYCFSAFGFSFPEVPSFYLLCMSFSKNDFFQLICALSLSGSQLLRDIMFVLLLFYFLLELFADQLMMPS